MRRIVRSEKLLWADRPSGELSFSGFGAFQAAFAVVFIGFGVFWVGTAITMGAPTFFILFGAFVPVAGAYQMFSPFWHEARERRNSVYAVTDKRSLIIQAGRNQKLRWQDHKTMPEIEYISHRNGTGTIAFGSAASVPINSRFAGVGSGDDRFAFKQISGADTVARILRNEAQKVTA